MVVWYSRKWVPLDCISWIYDLGQSSHSLLIKRNKKYISGCSDCFLISTWLMEECGQTYFHIGILWSCTEIKHLRKFWNLGNKTQTAQADIFLWKSWVKLFFFSFYLLGNLFTANITANILCHSETVGNFHSFTFTLVKGILLCLSSL